MEMLLTDTDTRRPEEQQNIARALLVVLTSFAAALLLILIYMALAPPSQIRLLQTPACPTTDCTDHSHALRAAFNRSVRPCDNFYMFVCGAWKPIYEGSISVLEDSYLDAAYDSIRRLSAESENSLPGRLFKVCMNSSVSEAYKLRNFMMSLNLTWPKSPLKGVSPLDVLLNLAINWHLDLWFSVHVIRWSVSRSHRFIALGEGILQNRWHLRKLGYFGQYDHYVEQYCNILGLNFEGINLTQLKSDDHAIFNQLLGNEGPPEEARIPIGNLQQVTAFISATVWLDLLNKHYKPHFKFTDADFVHVEHVRLMETVDALLRQLSAHRLLNVIGWTVLQEWAWMISDEAGAVTFRSESGYRLIKPLLCLMHTQGAYGILSLDNRTWLKAQQKEQVDRLLESIINSAMEMTEKSNWITYRTKVTAVAKLQGIIYGLWPADDVMNSSQASAKYYSDFPVPSSSFFDSYFAVVKKRRSLVDHEHYEDVYTTSFTTPHGPFRYFHVTNHILMTLSVLEPPLYYTNGTADMNYGGLGYHFAQHLVQAFDALGIQFDAKGADINWWSEESLRAYAVRSKCRVHDGGASELLDVFPFLPAMEVAIAAFRRRVSKQQNDLPLQGLEDFSADQTFFLTYCHSLCSKFLAAAHGCNYPLMNSLAFAKAFSCRNESFMNPANKCTFFS